MSTKTRFVIALVLTLIGEVARGQFLPDHALTIGTSFNEAISQIDVSPTGEVYGVGYVEGTGSPDILVVKQSATGSLLFAKTYDFGVFSSGRSVKVLPNGDIAISGYLETRFVDVLTMRLDSSGNFIWGRSWGSGDWDPGNGMTIDATGNIVQNVASLGLGNIDDVELRYDGSGNLLYSKGWHANVNDGSPREPVTDDAGNSYTTGHTGQWTFPGGQDIILVKRSPTGDIVWDRVWSGSDTESGTGLAIDDAGSLYLCGTSGSFGAGSWGSANMILIKFDSTGALLWERSWGGPGYDQAQSVWLAPDGAVSLVGSTNSFGAGGDDIALIRFSVDGTLLSQSTWGTSSSEGGSAIKGLGSGMFAIGGSAASCAGTWQSVAGEAGTPAGNISENVGSSVVPIGSVISVTPVVTDLPVTECSGGGGVDAAILTFRYCATPQLCDFDSQDVDCDGDVDVVDVVLTVNVAFRGAVAHLPCCGFE